MVVFLVGFLNASLFAVLTPAWQAPDEPGHYEYACLLGQLRRPLQGHDRSLNLQQAIIASLDRSGFWPLVREAQPAPLPASFMADPFLLRSASQVGDEPLTYYLAPAGICLLPLPMEAQARLMRLWSALLFGLTAAATAWAWQGRPLQRGYQAMVRLHPLTLALLPMPAFIAGSINNDSLAILTATLVFAAVLRAQRQGWTWRNVAGILVLLALALASKKTNAFLAPWLAALALYELWRLGRRSWSRLRLLTAFTAAAGILLFILVLPTPMPESWTGVGQVPAGRRIATVLPDGPSWAVLVVDRSPNRPGRLFQSVDLSDAVTLHGQSIRAEVWVRSPDGQPTPGRLLVRDTAGASEASFLAVDSWQPVAVQHTLAITTTYVRLVVLPTAGQSAGETGQLLVAQAAMWPAGEGVGATPMLRNGDFQRAARMGEVLAAPLQQRWRQFAPRSLMVWQDAERNLVYLALTFAGFWGNYGWLQRPLPTTLYVLLALATALAGVGVLLSWRKDSVLRPILSAWLLACALIAVQTFLPMLGRDWQPQGRYLFPALLPITGLLLFGLNHWLRLLTKPRRQIGLLAALLIFNIVGLATAAFIF